VQQPAVVGDLLQREVEGLVGLEEALDVGCGGGLFQVGVDRAQSDEVVRARARRRQAGARASPSR